MAGVGGAVERIYPGGMTLRMDLLAWVCRHRRCSHLPHSDMALSTTEAVITHN